MRKGRIIECCAKGELFVTEDEKLDGMKVVLVDDKNNPIARYEFEGKKLEDISKIMYCSNKISIDFSDIVPSIKYELRSAES